MKGLVLRSAALAATASMATLLALFLDWRGRILRRLGEDPDAPRPGADAAPAEDDAFSADWGPYEIDGALADSFPASDPPAWTPGVARLTPRRARVPA